MSRGDDLRPSRSCQVPLRWLSVGPNSGGMPHRPVVVAVNGSPADLPALAWAAEEAASTSRPLLISHAVGSLPPAMTYAERQAARQRRRELGLRVVDRAAEWVGDRAPTVAVQVMVRLLDPGALLPVVSKQAHAITQTGDAWLRAEGSTRRAPVVAVTDGSADASLLDFATGYARRRGVGLVVVDGHGPDAARRLLERRSAGSLLLLPHPGRRSPIPRIPWPAVLELFTRSRSPVALVPDRSGETTGAATEPVSTVGIAI